MEVLWGWKRNCVFSILNIIIEQAKCIDPTENDHEKLQYLEIVTTVYSKVKELLTKSLQWKVKML